MKNIGAFLAFNEEWFVRNQRPLLWLLNASVIKIWFRWILRIRSSDCPIDINITDVGPNRLSFGDRHFKVQGEWYLERTTDFRTHPKFGKRLYYAFRPLWWLVHFWDWLIADRFIPQWSYGFLTLTAYPEPDPEINTVDGYVIRNPASETFSTIRDAATGDDAPSDLTSGQVARLRSSTTSNQYPILSRGFFLFLTSALTSGATISSAVFSLWGKSKTNTLGSPDLHVAGSSPASNTTLSTSDYNQIQRTTFGNISYASFDGTDTAYSDITLNSDGLAAISKTGVTKFSTQTSWDLTNTFGGSWASATFADFSAYFADQTGTSKDPKLVVTYIASTTYTKDLTESFTATASLPRSTSIPLLESLSFAASLIKAPIKLLTEGFTASNILSALKVISSTLTESFGATETTEKSSGKNLTESITASATLFRQSVRTLSETFSLGDTLTMIRGKYLTLVEGIIATDSLIRSASRTLVESLGISAFLDKASGRVLTESVSSSDAIVKTSGKTLSEGFSVIDFIRKSITKVLTETPTVTDFLTSARIYSRILTESLSLTDLLSKSLGRVLTETFTLIARLTNWFRISRSSDATYNQTTRSSADDWTQTNRDL